jgi:hypothetical protein
VATSRRIRMFTHPTPAALEVLNRLGFQLPEQLAT